MPTPIGHALGAFAAGWIIAGPPASSPEPERALAADGGRPTASTLTGKWVRRAAAFAAIGLLADVDLALGIHSTYTHSIGAAVLVAVVAAAVVREQRLLLGAAAGAAYLSHVMFDLLSQDMSVPFGIMALWPISSAYYHSGLDLFLATDRRYWLDGFLVRNVQAVVRELLLVTPLAAAAWWVRRPRVRPR